MTTNPILIALAPVFFVLLLGYAAARFRIVDNHHVAWPERARRGFCLAGLIVCRDRVGLRSSPAAGPRILSGIDGSPVIRIDVGLDKLAAQISQTVQWASCLQGCMEAGDGLS